VQKCLDDPVGRCSHLSCGGAHGSLSGAARTLGIQQTTVGRRMSAFEAALGTRLFDRTRDGHAPTTAGRTLLAHARRIEREALAAERALVGHDARTVGVVRVTAPLALGCGFLAARLGRLRDELPGLILELIADDTNLSLTRRQADLAVRIGRPRQPGLIARRAGSVITGLYAARSYLARRAPLGDGLAGCDVIDYDDTYHQRQEVAWLRQRAHAAHVALRVNHTLGVATALQAGLGVGALPCWLGDATHDLERVLPATSFAQDLWIVIHRDLRHAARFRAVTDLLVAEIIAAAPVLLGRARAAKPRVR
jgi:DNA-binding transcriptional LysR family regulator